MPSDEPTRCPIQRPDGRQAGLNYCVTRLPARGSGPGGRAGEGGVGDAAIIASSITNPTDQPFNESANASKSSLCVPQTKSDMAKVQPFQCTRILVVVSPPLVRFIKDPVFFLFFVSSYKRFR